METADFSLDFRLSSTVDEGPGSHIDLWLHAYELDSKLRVNIHFSNTDALVYMVLPNGLEEF
jgi:hypothetical protein